MTEQQERIKDISIKILLTMPALIVGFFSAFMVILKPVIDLWKKKSDFERQVDEIIKETFPEK